MFLLFLIDGERFLLYNKKVDDANLPNSQKTLHWNFGITKFDMDLGRKI